MKLSEMQYLKTQYGYSYDKLATLSGIPKGTIQKIFTGVTKNPRYETLMALEKVLRKETPESGWGEYDLEGPAADQFAESTPYGTRQKKQGEYTLEDYYAIPDERRVELIDGVIYDMSAPTPDHQIIGFQIGHQIENYIEANKGSCTPFVAPCDVQIDCDDKTMLQPDVFVLCDKSKFRHSHIYGAPEFVVEILSKSTSSKDRHIKYEKYYTSGVKEYWIVDPFRERVIVYLFQENGEDAEMGDEDVHIYSFQDQVPVGIYQGKLKIDFARISKRLNAF